MNKAILMGRLTRDPELRMTSNNVSVCTFTLAVDRNYRNRDGDRLTDFIPIVVWRQQADFVSKYFSKGQRMLVVGSIQPRSYEDQSGQKRYVTEVIAEEVYFADSKRDSGSYYEEDRKIEGLIKPKQDPGRNRNLQKTISSPAIVKMQLLCPSICNDIA